MGAGDNPEMEAVVEEPTFDELTEEQPRPSRQPEEATS